MYSLKSYNLTKEEYNYLLPVLKSKLLNQGDKYSFVGSSEELNDMLYRLKGLYDNYSELNSMVAYHCFIQGSIIPFRDIMKISN